MRKKRKFYSGVLNHVYQRSLNGVNLFYEDEDFLVFYTIFSVCVRSSDVEALMLCIMFNHFHALLRARSVQDLSEFMDRFTSWFVRDFNYSIGRKGKLLKKNYGSAPKWTEKSVRSTINYIGNNPVEKGLCARAEEFRWNFLAYFYSDHPFSEPIYRDRASKPMRRALKEVDAMNQMNLPLKHAQLRRLFRALSLVEKQQIIDYIISQYFSFDRDSLMAYYASYEAMLAAMQSNTGSEHEIREEWSPESDTVFNDLIDWVHARWPEMGARSVIMLKDDAKKTLVRELLHQTSASENQLLKFFHLPNEQSGA